MNIKNLLLKLINMKQKPHHSFGHMRVLFYQDASYHGEHGLINVSNIKLGVCEQDVSFVMVGVTTPPKLSLAVLEYIFSEAVLQGYIPHHLTQYGRINKHCVEVLPQYEDTLSLVMMRPIPVLEDEIFPVVDNKISEDTNPLDALGSRKYG